MLSNLVRQTAIDVPHPTAPGKTLWDSRNDDGPYKGDVDPEVGLEYNVLRDLERSFDTEITPLGSGSDYTVFLQRLGVRGK